MNRFDQFLKLHHEEKPLLIANVWNVQSAKVFEKKGFRAIATSSSAVASSIGYDDGQEIPFDEYLYVIERIAASTLLPFSVDLEGGYGSDADQIMKNIELLVKAGVAGINLEDSGVNNGKRTILPIDKFTKKLQQITDLVQKERIRIFINVRSDNFILGLPNAVEDSLSRIEAYQQTGVHGFFFPCLKDIPDIKKITGRSKLPINVMVIPGLPGFQELGNAGVKRISMGPFAFTNIYGKLEGLADRVIKEQNCDGFFS
jgi:2-methylisocitrate lyase-like PEP mutase family enzyme